MKDGSKIRRQWRYDLPISIQNYYPNTFQIPQKLNDYVFSLLKCKYLIILGPELTIPPLMKVD